MNPRPRPNELTGEARPNQLATGKRSGRSSSPSPSDWSTWTPNAAASSASPSIARPSTPAVPARRRGFSIWPLFVLLIIGLNLYRAFADRPASPRPTTVPAATAVVIGPGETIDPNVSIGSVEFGTGVEDDCEITGAATTFPVGTPVWWYAHFEVYLPGDASVVYTLTKDEVELENGSGPDDTPQDEWNGLCSGDGFRFYGLGTYTFRVWDETKAIPLSEGTYEIVPAAGP